MGSCARNCGSSVEGRRCRNSPGEAPARAHGLDSEGFVGDFGGSGPFTAQGGDDVAEEVVYLFGGAAYVEGRVEDGVEIDLGEGGFMAEAV